MFREDQIPKWLRELESFVGIKSAFIIEGNINDIYPRFVRKNGEININGFVSLNHILYSSFVSNNPDVSYDMLYCDPINGFYNPVVATNLGPLILEFSQGKSYCSSNVTDTRQQCYKAKDFVSMSELIKNAITSNRLQTENKKPVAIVMNFASRYLSTPNQLSEEEISMFLNLLYGSLNAARINRLRNVLILVVDKINDLPTWFYFNNPNVKTISIPHPDKHVRQIFIHDEYKMLDGDDSEIKKIKQKFIDVTDGLKCLELREVRELSVKNNIEGNRILDALSLYKYGIKENPWNMIEKEKIQNAESIIKQRVMGQDEAVRKAVDVIKRAASGLSGLQHSSKDSKPRGILFLAGPTGTGKTELAKSIAELLFGDEKSCIRFDMSEYQQPHSDQKLLGAPPGYVGYESGGQLTNAVKERPFSILLFDEIEKAHPSILDKFLQILEDGRMTDGQGNTVYFSETIIIFTSNLGIYKTFRDQYGNVEKIPVVTPNNSYEEIKDLVSKGVKDYFLDLGRPELLNRIGNNNIIIFNFISDEAAKQIVKSQITKVIQSIFERTKISINLADDIFENYYYRLAVEARENGGRGIGNIVEERFINPVSRYICDNDIEENTSIKISVNENLSDIVIKVEG